jgi:hypothetical protein
MVTLADGTDGRIARSGVLQLVVTERFACSELAVRVDIMNIADSSGESDSAGSRNLYLRNHRELYHIVDFDQSAQLAEWFEVVLMICLGFTTFGCKQSSVIYQRAQSCEDSPIVELR